MYRVYRIVFDRANSWNSGDDYAKNVAIFNVEKISSCHADNHNNNFLVSVEGDILVLMEALVHERKRLILTLKRQR